MAVFPGKDAKPKSQDAQSADTERTEKTKGFSSVNSVPALCELRAKKTPDRHRK
jgi:hypothetical protein